MAFDSIKTMLETAEKAGCPLHEVICCSDCAESGISEEASHRKMHHLWEVMKQTSAEYTASDRSNSGLSGGAAQKVHEAAQTGKLLGGVYFTDVMEEALKTAECNACMKRIVAAPTAAAALTYLLDGSAAQCADAAAIALGNLLGLVCDPVAGLVEVPCVKRNVIGAVNAVSAANMVIAGLTSRIPADEVIDAMGEVGDMMNANLRETGLGGLAGTPTAQSIMQSLRGSEKAESK